MMENKGLKATMALGSLSKTDGNSAVRKALLAKQLSAKETPSTKVTSALADLNSDSSKAAGLDDSFWGPETELDTSEESEVVIKIAVSGGKIKVN